MDKNDLLITEKKLSIIYIYEILKKYSSAEHPITQEDISNYLKKDYGIELERKAVGRNVRMLIDGGYDIEKPEGGYGCYLNSFGGFDESELRFLVDSIFYSKQITKKQAKGLVDKICGLTNIYFKDKLKYTVIESYDEWVRENTENSSFFWNIDQIGEAIEKKKQISYDYNKYDKNKKLRKTSEHIVSPYKMVIRNQKYYLLCYQEVKKQIYFHKIDRITNIRLLDKKATPKAKVPNAKEIINSKNISSSPYMYSDKPEIITFEADAFIVDQLMDWFGNSVSIRPCNKEGKITGVVTTSPMAMEHWAMQYINHVEITMPSSLREKIKTSLEDGLKKYK